MEGVFPILKGGEGGIDWKPLGGIKSLLIHSNDYIPHWYIYVEKSNITTCEIPLLPFDFDQLLLIELVQGVGNVDLGLLVDLLFVLFNHADITYYTLEKLFDPSSQLGRSLTKTHLVVPGFSFGLLLTHLSFLTVRFIPHQNPHGLLVLQASKQFHPDVNLLEGLFPPNIIDKHSAVSISQIVGNQTFEFLLASSIP